MWYNYGHMWGIGGGIMMLVFWVVIILLIVWVVKEFGGSNCEKFHKKSALDILKERYAKGEIDKKEFEEKERDLKA
ncbi:MAG: SHOCT domain-containing protein [Patescibacteria group bacterium]